jgi:hypothetical protein
MDVYGRVARALLEFASETADGELLIRVQNFPPGHRQDGGRLARDGQPRDERSGRARLYPRCMDDGSIVVKERLALG